MHTLTARRPLARAAAALAKADGAFALSWITAVLTTHAKALTSATRFWPQSQAAAGIARQPRPVTHLR